MNFFSFLYKAIFQPLGCMITIIVLCILGLLVETCEGITGYFTDNYYEEYRELIKEGDYDEAHEYAQKHKLDLTDLLEKQTYDFLIAGDMKDAQYLCARENQMYVFFHTLTSNIQAIYDAHGIEPILLAFSMIPYPSSNDYSLSDEFRKQWGLNNRSYYPTEQIISENNRAIETLCNFLKPKGQTEEIMKVLEYLQPKPGDKGPDYTDVKRIKNKFKL